MLKQSPSSDDPVETSGSLSETSDPVNPKDHTGRRARCSAVKGHDLELIKEQAVRLHQGNGDGSGLDKDSVSATMAQNYYETRSSGQYVNG